MSGFRGCFCRLVKLTLIFAVPGIVRQDVTVACQTPHSMCATWSPNNSNANAATSLTASFLFMSALLKLSCAH